MRGTVTDVVYLGSVTQFLVLLPTGERLTVHRLNDEVGGERPDARAPSVELRWAAEHSYVIGGRAPETEFDASPAGAGGEG